MNKKNTRLIALLVISSLLFALLAYLLWTLSSDKRVNPIPTQTHTERRTVADVIALYGISARQQLLPYFQQANVAYPPKALTFFAMKQEALLEVWAEGNDGKWHFIHQYDIKRLSGQQGPKLREGDKQVPEGLYRVIGLNPNSAYHLSMKLNYPNAFDQKHADAEGRKEPGTNIFIHGKAVSVGCLAMGDQTIESLFVLASDVGADNIAVIISPYDPRQQPLQVAGDNQPEWLAGLYAQITAALKQKGIR